jgi:hypothetical protein
MQVMKCVDPTRLGLANLQCRWRRSTRIGDSLHVVLRRHTPL